MMNMIVVIRILPQANAKYVESISYSVRKYTKETLEPIAFSYIEDKEQEFVAHHTGHYAIQLWGADGRAGAYRWGFGSFSNTNQGGEGGYIVAQIYLKRGERLSIRVGGTNINDAVTIAGYNAGVNGGGGSYSSVLIVGGIVLTPDYAGGGGGGATDIRINGERVLVAGGGGGGGGRDIVSATGGDAGYAATEESANGMKGGSENSGGGGSATAGGAGRIGNDFDSRLDGTFEKGGSSDMLTGSSGSAGGGGGGGGYYGGGAAGAANDSGGGGSSVRIGPRMIELSAIALEDLPPEPTQEERGGRWSAKHGYVIISYLDPENFVSK